MMKKDFVVVNVSFAAPIYRGRQRRRSDPSSWIRTASSFGGKNGSGRSPESTRPTNVRGSPPGSSKRVGTPSSGAETLAGIEVWRKECMVDRGISRNNASEDWKVKVCVKTEDTI